MFFYIKSVSVLATYLIESKDVEFDNTTANIPDVNGDETVSVQEAIDYLINNMSSDNIPNFILDSQGGTELESQKPDRYSISLLPTPTKSGYSFIGWYDAAIGGNKITSSTAITENKTIYAHWSESFSADSWATIKEVVQAGVAETIYNVGDTKTVSLGTYGNYTVRVSNTSTPLECLTQGFSQTACGFVVEFADIITTHNMNSSNSSSGGWPATSMRSWLNNETTGLLSYFPSELQNVIADTTVVSGHNAGNSGNFTTTDKLYLLSTHEVWQDVDGNTSRGIDYYDTAYSKTRQLDYYKDNNVTTSSYAKVIKKNNGSDYYWWIRPPYSASGTNDFFSVTSSGGWGTATASTAYGVSPAFRIE